ncbi:MAG: hypothetical protein ABI904_21900 [Chloroflexota bacterium]
MKKIVILLLAVTLAACSTPAAPTQQPVAAPIEPSATPVVVVQTVVVEATQAPTEVPPPTAVPPTAEPVVVVQTVVVQPTQAAPTQAPAQTVGNAPITLDAALGKGVFTNMTMSSNAFTLRCAPRDITFNITTMNQDIVGAVFYYRVVDNKRLYPSEWKSFGKMVANGNGNFTLTFKGEDIAADLRLDNSWFDFQFVGLAKSGDVVDRTEKIQELVKYTFDCP